MEIYIEQFLIQNILINICLLRLIYLTTKNKTTLFKLILASTLGTIFSVFYVTQTNNIIITNLFKFIAALIMLITAFKQTKKQFVFNFILLFLYTYAFGGIILSLNSKTYLTNYGFIMKSKFSLEMITTILMIFTYFIEYIAKHIKTKIITNDLIYKLTLTHQNKTIHINAYMDTGNFLNINGKPVLILDLDSYLNLTNTNLINFLTMKTEQISAGTINATDLLKIVNIDKITIQHNKCKQEINNPTIAINSKNCFKETNYQALLSPLFL